MENSKRLPAKIIIDNIEVKKINPKKNDNLLEELLSVYIKNREHLSLWHHEWEELLFNDINDIKKHLRKNRLFCYVLVSENKIIGCIEVGYLKTDENNLKYRILTYWIDNKYTRKGIMYKALYALENIFIEQKLNILMTEVDVDNKPSIKLMKKLNYGIFSVCWLVSENGKTEVNFGIFKKLLFMEKSTTPRERRRGKKP